MPCHVVVFLTCHAVTKFGKLCLRQELTRSLNPSRSSEHQMLLQQLLLLLLRCQEQRAMPTLECLGTCWWGGMGPAARLGSLPWSWLVKAHEAQGISCGKLIVSIQFLCACLLLAACSWAGDLPGPQIPHQENENNKRPLPPPPGGYL